MVRLRKSKNKLKIILCCILGFIVAVGGIVGILVLVPLMEGEKEPPVVDSAVNEKNDPGDMTYEQHAASGDDGYRTLTYLAYVLSEQPYYHSESVTVSVAPFNMTQYTKSFKDYSDGIMISSDLTYGIKNAGTQAAFVPGGNEEGRGAGVYMRTSSGSVNADSTGTSVSWNDDVVYYDRESYLYAYGEYSTEMTVYLLTEETITSWDPATDNGDGTYTQTFYLDAEKACYYYQYAMKTRGGLLTLPVFESISMEVTFDNNYRVLQIDVVENSRINPFTWMDSTSTTTTSYTYGEENFDRPHYDYYAGYFEQYVGNLGSEDGDDDELTPLDLLMNAFAGVLNGEGQQFDAVVMAGGKTYYGRVYLSLDINGISSGDILGSIDARIALSEDENIDEQDLYISFADGDIRAYYSSDFALSADVNEFSDIVSQFESWVQGLSGDGTAAADEGGSADEGGFSLDELLQQFTNGTTEEYDGGLTYTASLEISGISLDAVFDFSKQDGGDAATYSLNTAQIGGIAYNGSPVELSLALEPSAGEIISHEESETPFDLSVAAQNLYELLNSDAIGVEISLGGEKLADFLSSLGIADLGASLDDLSLQISGAVDINGITVAASFTLSDINAGRTVLAADVYYVYNDGSGEYGTAYLNISNILGAETSAKVYCDIAELAATIQTLIDRLSSGDVAEDVSEGSEGVVSAADGSDIVSLINGILGLDLGAVVKEVNAGAAVIGATVDLDSVFALLGADVSLGDITLEYHLGDFDREDYNNAGGWLYGSIPSLGAEAYIYGSDAAVGGIEKDDYLDLDELVGSVGGIINSAVVEINLEISGEALADVLASNGIVDLGDSADGLVLEIEGSVSASELEARLALSLHDENKIYFAADAYYVYGGEGYGTAYIDLTHILGARYDGIKVYCDIAELASAVGWLVDDAAGQTEGAGTEESAGIAGIITGILTIDLGGIVKELSTNADGLTTTVDIDGILEYFTETDITLGDVTLEYTLGEGVGKLSGTALGGGLTMSVTGSDAEISAPDTEEYYDLTALVNSIYEIFESNTVRVILDITGEALSEILAENGITGADELLAGANIHVSGNIDIDTLAVKGTLSFSGADRTYFAADVFYSYDEDGYGDIYLSITELLGSECNIKVYGNIGDIISSVEELIGTVAGGDTAGGAASGAEVSQVADIVSQILSVNLGSIVRWLRIDEYGVYASVDIDNLLGSLTGTELGLGSMQMQYDGHFLSGTAMNGSLELLLYGSEMNAYRPAPDAYLDIVDLLALINNAKAAVQKIIDGNSVYFSIANAEIAVNGVTFSVSGEGEAVWDDVSLVSLALDLTFATGGKDGTSENTVKLIYNAGAADDEPLVKLTINEVGLIITQNDIDRFGEDLNGLIAAINNLLGGTAGSSTGNADDSRLVAIFAGDDSVGNDVAGILQLILGIFNGEYEDGTLGNVLTELFDGLFSDLLEGGFGIEDGQLTVNVGGLNVTFGADPDKGLYLSGSVENIAVFNAGVSAGTGSYAPEFADGTVFYSSAADGNSGGSFTRAIYNFIFGTYESVDIGSFLGGDAYSVNIKLTGDNSDIEALKGVAVNADLYFAANKAEGAVADQKIAGADIAVTADSFTFAADFIFSGDMLYITLTEINGAELNIVLKASAGNIYRAVENLIKVVQNDKIVSLVSGLFGGQAAAASTFEDIATYGGSAAGPESDNIADLISAILNFKYSEIIGISSDEDSFVATLNIDELLDALNVNAGTPIGTATLRLAGGENRGIYIGIDDWLTVNAQPDKDVVITVPEDSDDIIDIGFVADLIDDMGKFLPSYNTDTAGRTLYSLTGGKIDVKVNLSDVAGSGVDDLLQWLAENGLTVQLNNIDIVIGLDANSELYFSLEANTVENTLDLLGSLWSYTIVEANAIGVTYSNGVITLSKGTGNGQIYWVMTPEYFIDNMFVNDNDETDSPLRWLLGTSSTIWNIVSNSIADLVSDISSGTALPQELYFYGENSVLNSGLNNLIALADDPADGEQAILLADYLSGYQIKLGDTTVSYNDYTPDTNLTLGSGDYYAFSLNAGNITGDVLSVLDIALTSNSDSDNIGLDGVSAYGSLDDILTFTFNIGTSSSLAEVPDYFSDAMDRAAEILGTGSYELKLGEEVEADGDYATITNGGVKIESSNASGNDFVYDTTYELADNYYKVNIYAEDGSLIDSYGLRYGSTLHFYQTEGLGEDDTLTIYLDENGEVYSDVTLQLTSVNLSELDKDGDEIIEFTQDTVVYQQTVNGVVYQFVGSTSNIVDENGVHIPHYKITSASLDEKYTRIENPETLVLENEFKYNGSTYPVCEIEGDTGDNGGAFGKALLKNVVVPENITYVGERAFLDNYGMISAVFLADEVTFAGATDGNTYPFYGCSESDGGTTTKLTVYFNSINGSSESLSGTSENGGWISGSTTDRWTHFRHTGTSVSYSDYYFTAYGAGTWTYIEYALSEDSVINEAGLSEDVIFSGLQFVTTDSVSADMIAEIVLENIDAFTAENCGYINGYYVDVIVEQVNNRATVTVSLAEGQEQERYYAADSLEISSTVEGADTELDLFEITYAEFKPYGADGRIFVKADSDVIFTLKQEFADYYSLSKVGDNEADGDSYVFDSMTDAVNFGKITLDFEAIGNYVTVYSDISFAYGGAQYAGDSSANQMLVGASVSELGSPSTTQSDYYFLGWATKGNNGLEFNSVVADNATYYAIWVNSSRAFIYDGVLNGSDLPGLTSTTDGTFAGWYGGNFRNTTAAKISGINEIPENKTTVYARWSFTVTLSGSNATITSNNQTSGSFMAEEGSTVAFTVKYDYDDSQGFSVKDSKGKDVTYELSNNQYQFSMPSDNVEIKASSENCIAAGSLITLADGSQKKVEDLTGEELLLVWNLETGSFDTAPIVFIDSDAECEYEIINLIFSDGTEVKVISEHAFWDYDLNEYVYLDRYAGKYIGHWFNKQTTDDDGNFANTAVQLTDVVITYEVTTAYSPVTYSHLCYYVNGMLSMPGGISGLFNIFEVDPETMMYDREAMEADIAEYGLFTYEDFEGLISEEVFEAFNGKYLKVAIGKGILTWDDIFYLVERYSQFF